MRIMIYVANGAPDKSHLYAILEPATGFWWEFNTYQENANRANKQVVPGASVEVSRGEFDRLKNDMAERREAFLKKVE